MSSCPYTDSNMKARDELHNSKCAGTYEMCEQDEHKETVSRVRSTLQVLLCACRISPRDLMLVRGR
jgi:hypothetical protein